jgi:nucleoside-diphosphate-sugar epimerase
MMWFGPVIAAQKEGKTMASIPAKEDALLSLVHKDDLASAYVLFVEKVTHLVIDSHRAFSNLLSLIQAAIISQISYPVFNLSTSQETLSQIMNAVSRVLGYKGKIEYVTPSNAFEEAMSTSVVFNGNRAKELLGWDPRHTSFTAGMDVYLRAILAHM